MCNTIKVVNVHTAIVDDNNFLIKSVRDKSFLFDDIRISFTANDGLQCMENYGSTTAQILF